MDNQSLLVVMIFTQFSGAFGVEITLERTNMGTRSGWWGQNRNRISTPLKK